MEASTVATQIEVGLEFPSCCTRLLAEDGSEEKLDLRMPIVTSVDRLDFSDYVTQQAEPLFGANQGQEPAFSRFARLMLSFFSTAQAVDPRRTRPFNIHTLDTSETLREMAAMTKMKFQPAVERLIACGGESAFSSTRLLVDAIYIHSDLQLPLSRKHYLEFREQFLEELEHGMQRLARIQKGIDEAHDSAHADKLRRRLERSMGKLFQRAMRHEESLAIRFTDLVETAGKLMEPVANEVEQRSLAMLAEDGETFSAEYSACIVRNFDEKAADALLDAVISRYEEVYDIDPFQGESVAGETTAATSQDGESVSNAADLSLAESVEAAAKDLPIEVQKYRAFVASRHRGDLLDKWSEIGWVTTNLVDRNACIRLIFREAEAISQGILHQTFKEIYRGMRHQLTRAERRVFQLLYLRQPQFGYRIAVVEPVLLSFFTGMDEETRTIILLVLAFKRHTALGHADLDKELQRRWRAYLRFYPYWLEILRLEDREACRRRMQSKTLSLDQPLGEDEEGNTLTLLDTCLDGKSQRPNLLQAMVTAEEGKVGTWTTRYCTARQASHVIRRFVEDKTETHIAAEDKITQQAVSKSISAGLKRIREGLLRDGVVEK